MNWKPACPSCTSTWASDRCGEMEKQSDGGNQMMELLGVPPQVLFGQLLLGLDQRVLLRAAEPRLGRHLRHAQRHQLRSRRPVHAGRLRGVDAVEVHRHRLLVGADPGPAGGRIDRRRAGKADAEPALQARPPLRPAADLRAGPDHRGHVPPLVRRLRPALPDPEGAGRRLQPRLHVPADIPRLGRHRLGRGLLRHLVRDRAHQAGRLSARRHREPGAGPGLRHQRAGHDHGDLRRRRGAGRAGRRAGRTRSIRSTR